MAIIDRFISAASGTNTYAQSTNMATPMSLTTAIGQGQAGDRMNVRADGIYSRILNDSLTGAVLSTSPIIWRGWNLIPGDGFLGRVNGNDLLITTNMPMITYTPNILLTLSSGFQILDSLQISGSRANNVILSSANQVTNNLQNCVIINNGTAGQGLTVGGKVENCDIFVSSATGASIGINATLSLNRVFYNRIIMSSNFGNSVGILLGGNATSLIAIGNTIIGNSGNGMGIQNSITTELTTIIGNTIVGWQDGINILSGTPFSVIENNLITDNSGYGINVNTTGQAVSLNYNRFRNNASGNYNLNSLDIDWFTGLNYNIFTGGIASDYINFANQDFRLVNTSPAIAAGLTPFASIGANQLLPATGTVGGETSYAFV